MLLFVILAIIILIIGYVIFHKNIEGLTTPTPNALPIPEVIHNINTCDYPIIWQGILSAGISKNDLQTGVSNWSDMIKKQMCNPSNPQNLTNQNEICSIFTDLSNSYENVVAYNKNPSHNINPDSCPVTVYDPSSNGLSQASVCNLFDYVKQAKQFEDSMRTSGKIPKNQPPIVDNMITIIQGKCSDSNPNACIIGNALVGNLPSYCSISTSPVSGPSSTPSVADIVNMKALVSNISSAGF
jgi:hypothetical protein